jgi:hypothetical protein
MTTTVDPLDHLDASLRDFEPSLGSPAHSGFRSDDAASDLMNDSGMEEELEQEMDEEVEEEEDVSAGGYSPPAWRRLGNGDRSSGFWRNGNDINGRGGGGGDGGVNAYGFGGFDLGGHRSRGSSPEYDSDGVDDEILEQAIRTRLPTGSLSPEKERSPEPEPVGLLGAAARIKRESGEEIVKPTMAGPKEVSENCKCIVYVPVPKQRFSSRLWQCHIFKELLLTPAIDIRFAVRAEVQQRTEPIETAIAFVRNTFGTVTRSWTSLVFSTLAAIVAYSAMRSLFEPASLRPVPDLVKVAGIARSFEPLIYYSENGVQQVGDLQATGVAVWDLGESVRTSNMSSAPIIVKELDELSDSLKTLAIELTKFFANVDGDIDG